MVEERLVTPDEMKEDESELSLRPERLNQYIGQTAVKENLRIFIDAAKNRNESLDHVLLFGPPGLGKTTLATMSYLLMKFTDYLKVLKRYYIRQWKITC